MRKNGAEIYNRTALDNTLIYSGVIDMPAGHGHMTLEFSVSAWLVNNWYPTASISDLLVVVMKKALQASRLAEFYNPDTGARNGAFFIAEKREVIMRKLCAVILSAVVWQVAAATPASAAEHQSTLSAGYLHASTNVPGSDDLNGINVKYRYEFTDALGLITSFSYANAEDEQKTRYSDTRWHEDSVRNRWFSVMAGPSVRVNEWFSAYAMAGVAYSRVSTFAYFHERRSLNNFHRDRVITFEQIAE
ncbi:putative prophage-encoded outer membrane protein [Escherichia coli]|nr:putative prophage-encoded outer membrane protein [Escherichia coli]